VIGNRYSATVQVSADRWLSFRDPALVLCAEQPEAVGRTIADVEQLTRDRGLHAVGFVSYEAAAAFGLPVHTTASGVPLVWFALYEPAGIRQVGPPQRSSVYSLGPLVPSVEREAFAAAFERVRQALAAGDSYQANYTFRMTAPFEGDAMSLFADLVAAQRGHYGAFIDLGDLAVCSASPELFFEFHGIDVVARPMKGTAARGLTLDDDRAAGLALAASAKNRAENVMIVDMVRNDIGRVAEVGSVRVPELFVVERYPTVWQMTSTVMARCTAPLEHVFAALHPSASVTGAPKLSTMRLLQTLETAPRGLYTGAIGHVPPDGLARFNVAIRTAVVDRAAATLTFGIGSGIVWDSDPSAEYDECLLKASILGRRPVPFDLLETLRWTAGEGFYLLDWHMTRLRASAEYFGIAVAESDVERALERAVAGETAPQRVRLLVSCAGDVRAERQPYVARSQPVMVRLAPSPIDREDVFLYHKTTHRIVYEQARQAAGDCDDVLLWNERGEVTEATTANLVVEIDGVRLTPPVGCGLLPGTCRAALLASGAIVERIITIDDLRRGRKFWLINAVHGWMRSELREKR
jgi:para-aminobenzoate synthetase/4-amino-4-deoxychorismate lyase